MLYLCCSIPKLTRVSQLPDNIFADIFAASDAGSDDTDELTAYLACPCENIADEDVLAWWRAQTQYPRVAPIAISYLTCPGEFSLISF